MKRRLFLSGGIVFILIADVCKQVVANIVRANMLNAPPKKIRLVPDGFHIQHVGRLVDGRLFWVDSQLDPSRGSTKDFVCSFIFDPDGHLSEHIIEAIGVRGSYPEGSVKTAMDRHVASLGEYSSVDIWVRPFSVESNGAVFGLIPRQVKGGEWRVEFMPGNTLSFYAPWELGEYDT